MALCEVRYFSNALQKMTAMNVILPEGHQGPFPVFYLLHGFSGNHSDWARNSKIESYVADYPLIVVMPDGGRGFYTDSLANPREAYESAIVPELIELIDNTFRTKAVREGRVIGGFSMGGYGALKLAIKHPSVLCAAASHSGVLGFARDVMHNNEESRLSIGEDAKGGPNDLFALMERAGKDQLPAMRIDCGVEDGLIGNNRDFHGFLEGLGIAHEYAEYPGDHNLEYCDEHVQEAVTFFAGILGIEKRS